MKTKNTFFLKTIVIIVLLLLQIFLRSIYTSYGFYKIHVPDSFPEWPYVKILDNPRYNSIQLKCPSSAYNLMLSKGDGYYEVEFKHSSIFPDFGVVVHIEYDDHMNR